MSELRRDIVDAFKGARSLEGFFSGPLYPVASTLLVLLSHLCAQEFIFGGIAVVLFCTALVLCRSARPIIAFSISIVFFVSLKHSPGVPYFSGYLVKGFGAVLLFIYGFAVAVCLIYYVIRNRVYASFNLKTPQLIPLLILSLAFLLNGAFGGSWSKRDLIHGACQAAAYTGLFLLYYCTLRREDKQATAKYLVFASSAVAWMLSIQVLARLFAEGVVVNGSIDKNAMLFGWGVWNTAGVSLTVLIPLLFLGVMRSRHPIYYFGTAIVAYLCAVLTMSRGALLFGGVAFVLCCIASCFIGENKTVSRIITGAGVLCVLLGAVVLWDKISSLLKDFLERGFSDNGRYDLWRTGIENFLKAPIFGIGFFSFVSDSFVVANFFPKLAHQTFIQLLSSMGIFGALSYLFYRAVTIIPVVRRPSLVKSMLFASALVLIAQSAIDTYMFRFHAILLYSLTLALNELIAEDEKNTVNTPN